MHIADLRKFAMRWLHKTEEVRADMAHWPKKFTGDVYEAGWISEMYGYSFAAAEVKFHTFLKTVFCFRYVLLTHDNLLGQLRLRHVISDKILIYPGYVPEPGVNYRVFHYGLEFQVGNWSFDKAKLKHMDVVNKCWLTFPDPPDPSTLDKSNDGFFQRDLLSIECGRTLHEAIHIYHQKKCSSSNSLSPPSLDTRDPPSLTTAALKAPDPPVLRSPDRDTTGEVTTARKVGKLEKIDVSSHDSETKNEAKEFKTKGENNDLSPPAETNQTFTSMRGWILGLWAFSIVGFLAVMYVMISSRRGQRKRGKAYKSKRRSSYVGSWDRNTEMP